MTIRYVAHVYPGIFELLFKFYFLLLFRHVIVPRKYTDMIPKHHLMTETEWRNLGIQQSPGWIHYLIHKPGNCYFDLHGSSLVRKSHSLGRKQGHLITLKLQ